MLLIVLFHFGPDTWFTFSYINFHLAKFSVMSFQPIEIILNPVSVICFYVNLRRVTFKTGFHFVKQVFFWYFYLHHYYILLSVCCHLWYFISLGKVFLKTYGDLTFFWKPNTYFWKKSQPSTYKQPVTIDKIYERRGRREEVAFTNSELVSFQKADKHITQTAKVQRKDFRFWCQTQLLWIPDSSLPWLGSHLIILSVTSSPKYSLTGLWKGLCEIIVIEEPGLKIT